MGLLVSVYRNAEIGDCTNGGLSAKHDALCVVNMEGPFEPSEKYPAFELVPSAVSGYHLEPVDKPEGMCGPMCGGNLASTSDSRFRAGGNRLDALRIHDRFESWEDHAMLSR